MNTQLKKQLIFSYLYIRQTCYHHLNYLIVNLNQNVISIQIVCLECLLDISTKILHDQAIESNRDSKSIVFNRIKEITLEAFSKQFTDEIHRLQAELRQEQALNDQIKREFLEREETIIQEFDSKQREFQLQQIREIQELQDLLEASETQLQKYQQQNDKFNKQIKELQSKEQQLLKENLLTKENLQQCDQRYKQLNSDINDMRSRNDSLNQQNQQLDRQNRDFKNECERALKELTELKRKSQQQMDLNIQLDQEIELYKNEIEKLKTKKHQELSKQKELLDQLKEKSNNKINELKNRLKEAQNIQQYQQEQLDEFQELIRESENQLNQLQTNHKQNLKQMEQQYTKQFQDLEQQFLVEKLNLEENLTISFEQVVIDKDKQIQDLIKEVKILKDKLYQQNLEQEKMQRQQQNLEQEINQLNDELNQQTQDQQELENKNRNLELDITKKDQKLKALLAELDDIKIFQEQTLNTIRENQDYIAEIDKENQQYQQFLQHVQHLLDIQIQGSFSLQRLGQEIEQKLRQHKDDIKRCLDEIKKKEELHNIELQEKDQKLMLLQNNFNEENNKIQSQLQEQQSENRKQRNEFKLKFEEQNKIIIELQKDQIESNNQIEFLQIQNQQIIQDLESNNDQLECAKQEIQDMIKKDKMQSDEIGKQISILNHEKNQLQVQLEEYKFKQKTLKQRIIRTVSRQKELTTIQLIELKNTLINKYKQLESDCKLIMQNLYKKQLMITENKLQMIENDKQFEIEQLNLEMEKKLDNLKKQFKQSEQLIYEEGQIKLKQKQQQIEQLIMSKANDNEFKTQISLLNKENEEFQKQLQLQEQLFIEQKQNYELELMNLNKLIKEQQEELISQQQFSEYTMNKERQYFEQRYQELKLRQEKKVDSIQQDYQLQITQLENIIQQPTKMKSQSPNRNIQKSPIQNRQTTQLSNKSQSFGSPNINTGIKTPNKTVIQIDNTDKTIEDLRLEIQQQKEKLSRMKLTFTESQKKPFKRN
ncbi:unnamed protein product (macronuclear) [Paramecium tetraurelia]|uniref:Uncharacterized protein n=1 Tax=Paramecium tetraurelia TaxID=5888 RepID=A0CYI5_PARTE|nr:uncharacterized protein GSPATT00011452001 [Paramecium tetraurelia]CAK75852.1 unnamed protein product [Paramecium tetraurelia]|eukprot:XP_001443249.1 hypothetical protein (macronuclear) [Paramecium tetraurelia strain d4-2]